MATGTTKLYHTYSLYIGASTAGIEQINHDSDTFKMMLIASADSFNNDHSVISQVTAQEITHQNYPAGGPTLASVTYTLAASGTATFDADNVIVTASGSDLSAQACVVYKAIASSDRSPLLFLVDFNGTQTAGVGTTFNINWNASGIVQVKQV